MEKIRKVSMDDKVNAFAEGIASRFLANGNYSAVGAMAGDGGGISPMSSSIPSEHFDELGFNGLSVQAVGISRFGGAPGVCVYVTKGSKQSLEKLSTSDNDFPIRVIRLGKVVVKPEIASSTTNRGRFFERDGRVACGSSCAPSNENYAGTFGALVRHGKTLMALSNNHVFGACNHTPIGLPIMAPAMKDSTPSLTAPREICRHSRILELRSGNPELVSCDSIIDAAIALVVNAECVTSWQGDNENGFDTPSEPCEPDVGMRVKKVGRTTGITFGTIETCVTTPTPILYHSTCFKATVWFRNVWTVRAEENCSFALPGDSGSLVVTEDANAAVGLLFAGSQKGEYGYIIPIQTVLDSLEIELVGNHGV